MRMNNKPKNPAVEAIKSLPKHLQPRSILINITNDAIVVTSPMDDQSVASTLVKILKMESMSHHAMMAGFQTSDFLMN